VDSFAPQVELIRPWRTATLVAATVAGVELVLLLVAGSVLLGRSLWPHVHAAAARAALETRHHAAPVKPVQQPPAVAKLPRSKTGILILNGNGVQGAAAEAATLVDTRGYPVVATPGERPADGLPTWRLMAAPATPAKRCASRRTWTAARPCRPARRFDREAAPRASSSSFSASSR
jgi:hypothetical protein